MTRLRTAMPALIAAIVAGAALALSGCGGSSSGDASTSGSSTAGGGERPVIAVTTPVLGAIVRDAVGDAATVQVVMPNGADPHEWRPSAKDVAEMQQADMLVRNGLGLEQGLEEAVDQAKSEGVPVFTATDHIRVRTVKDAGAAHGDDHGHDHGHDHGDEGATSGSARDPHFWTDPSQVRRVVLALAPAVGKATGADATAQAKAAAARLAGIDADIRAQVATVPAVARNIVTGHESLGYFADRYGLGLIGAVTPSLSTQGQVSAAHLKELEQAMEKAGARVVFTETGLPNAVADAIVGETGATLVELGTEALPADGTYATYIQELSRRISSALANTGG